MARMIPNSPDALRGALTAFSSVVVQATDQTFYYGIGGGEPISRPASNRNSTVRVGGDVAWNTDLMCGNFDMTVSVSEQLAGIKGSFSDLMDNVISAATGAVASCRPWSSSG